MIGKHGQGPRMCARCGARVDERRGRWSTVCLVCGNALPPPAAEAKKTSSALPWILGIVALLLFVGGGIVTLVIVLVLRSAPPSEEGPIVEGSRVPAVTASVVPPPTGPTPTDTSNAPPDVTPSASAKPPPPPFTDEERDELAGNYTCAIDDTPAFRCRVANNILEKLEGSQRFKGPVSKISGGNLSFSGTYFCPFGACTRAVSTTFVRQGPGRYVGRFAKSNSPGSGGGGERVVLTKVR